VYLASSVVRALRENETLTIFGLDMITCPVHSCVAEPESCSRGQNESCKKKVEILYEYEGFKKFTHLIFRYQLNGHIGEGFVRNKDLAVKMLIKRGILNKENLITV